MRDGAQEQPAGRARAGSLSGRKRNPRGEIRGDVSGLSPSLVGPDRKVLRRKRPGGTIDKGTHIHTARTRAIEESKTRLHGGVGGGRGALDTTSAAAATHLLPPGVAGVSGEPEESSQPSPALEQVLEAGRQLENLMQQAMQGGGGAGFPPSGAGGSSDRRGGAGRQQR